MLLPILCFALLAVGESGESIDTKFLQVSPDRQLEAPWQRAPSQSRAVVLVHGLRIHPFSSSRTRRADFQGWQEPGSGLVNALANHADIYAFAYSQNANLDAIASNAALGESVRQLQAAGYQDIVLIGHSAGGLIARQFVEDHLHAGVTKVIQVCSPNGGSSLGKLAIGVCECQEPFLQSLTKTGRRQTLSQRADLRIPAEVEFVCLVGQLRMHVETDLGVPLGDGRELRLTSASMVCGDGVLSQQSQWPDDLRQQGIPAYPLPVAHFTAMFSSATARRLCELITEPQPRWTRDQTAAAALRHGFDLDAEFAQ